MLRELDDDVDVRFADERAEALRGGRGERAGDRRRVLLVVGEVPAADEVVDRASVEVYRSELDWSNRVLTIEPGESQWTVTSSVVVDEARPCRSRSSAGSDDRLDGGSASTASRFERAPAAAPAPRPSNS